MAGVLKSIFSCNRLASACEEALQRLCGDASVPELGCGAAGWGEALNWVWELYIGGYQVMKKWVSYREYSFLKRSLTLAEAEEVQAMAAYSGRSGPVIPLEAGRDSV